jgi:hypothetical protein
MSKVSRHALLSCLQADLSHFNSVDKKSPFVDVRSVAATQLLESVFKKFEDPNPRADAKAIETFLEINRSCGSYKLVAATSWDEDIITSVKAVLDDFLHPKGMLLFDTMHTLFMSGAAGPGASILGRGGDFYTKMFSSVLSTSDLTLYASYRTSLKDLYSWTIAEGYRFSTLGGPKLVEGNRLSCVPKNVDISRTICTEPTLNMWYQLGLGNVVRDRLGQFFGIDLETVANVNRRLAHLGSLGYSDDSRSYCTIDLKSASDSISLGLVGALFPKWFSDILKYLRSPVTRMPDGNVLALNMISTMGNGYTFPLQTLLFSAVVSAVYKQMGIPLKRVDSKNPTWSVFGDDIVVLRKAYDRVCHVLTLFGFVVNADKSYKEGPFRESCGCDYYNGHFVRGVYLRRLKLPQDTYAAFNKFVRWSALTGIELHSTLQYLLKKARFNPVPFWESDDAGFKVPDWWPWNQISARSGLYAYKAYVRRVPEMKLRESSITVPGNRRRRLYNPEGLIVSVSRGDWVDSAVPVSHDRERRFVQVRRVAPNWYDAPVPDVPLFRQGAGSRNWLAALRRELRLRRAIEPIAGSVEGRRCETVFWTLLNK